MPLSPLSYREVKRKLEAAGFTEVSQKGSHVKFGRHTTEGFRTAIVPRHRDAVVALAADENVFRRTGAWTSSWEVARDYGLCDADGTAPDWGQYFASIVSSIQSIHDGLPRQIAWLDEVVRRTKCYAGLD